MRLFDKIKISIWNIRANRSVAKRIIVGMVFVLLFLECSFALIISYSGYEKQCNEKHQRDCFYYTESDKRRPISAWSKEIVAKVEEKKRTNSAKETIGFFNLEPASIHNMEVGKIQIKSQEKKHFLNISNGSVGNWGIKNTWSDQKSSFKMNLIVKDIGIFPSYVPRMIEGRMPSNPGEILVDDYFLSMFNMGKSENKVIGKSIDIDYIQKKKTKTILEKYTIVGVFDSNMISKRESDDFSNFECNHIYVNLKDVDYEKYELAYENVRYYYDNFSEYYNAHPNKKELLLQQDYELSENEFQPSKLGAKFCVLNYMMKNVGELFLILFVVIVVIIICSLGYFIISYRAKQQNYRTVAHLIGMTGGSRRLIFAFELIVLFLISFVIASYISFLLLRLLNYSMQTSFDFKIVFMG